MIVGINIAYFVFGVFNKNNSYDLLENKEFIMCLNITPLIVNRITSVVLCTDHSKKKLTIAWTKR